MSADLNQEEITRYSRHLILHEVGMAGQKKLKAANVLCVGAGGLGSPALMYLAAAGVGRIGIVDFDVVDKSNLQRQIIHGSASVGIPKVHSAKARLHDINPHIEIDIYERRLTSSNALDIIAKYDIVVDGTDNFPTRYLLNDACVILGKPYVYGSIFKFDGQVSLFNHKGCWVRPPGWNTFDQHQKKKLQAQKKDWFYDTETPGPQYRDLYPEPPEPGLVPSCAEGGVLGILPGIIGSIQANEVLKIILGIGRNLSGRMLCYDALDMRFTEYKLQPDPLTPKITKLIDYHQFCGISNPEIEENFNRISVTEAKKRIESGWSPFVLDVRKTFEAEIASLDFVSRQYALENIEKIVAELPRDRDILIHCKRGGRSVKAAHILGSHGFEKIYNLEGGITAWAEEIDPRIPVY